MLLHELFEVLNKKFSYNIEMLGNSDGFIVQIWDGYGLRRAHSHEGTLIKAIKEALKQYDLNKEI